MRPVHNGRVAISWMQTELDELEAAPLAYLVVGAAWSWRGQAVFLSADVEQSIERAGNVGAASTSVRDRFAVIRDITGDACGSVVLTNGAQQFHAELVVQNGDTDPTFVFENGCPPRDQAFWISEICDLEVLMIAEPMSGSTVVAFPRQVKA